MTDQSATHETRSKQAQEAWEALPHGGHDEVRLRVQCSQGHHVANVYDTAIGSVYAATVRARSHGSRDRVDEPHGAHEARRWFDILEVPDDTSCDDALPAWCDCGHRVLSRVALLQWIATGEHRVVVD